MCKKKTKDKIMVRGFWGDIQVTPYISFGVEVDRERERTWFAKQINYQQVYVSELELSFAVHF
jgi:dynein assembly factor 3, axonemal